MRWYPASFSVRDFYGIVEKNRDTHSQLFSQGLFGDNVFRLWITEQIANGNSHKMRCWNNQYSFIYTCTQRCGYRYKILIIKFVLSTQHVENPTISLHIKYAICSYTVFHKLTPLMMRGFLKNLNWLKLITINTRWKRKGKKGSYFCFVLKRQILKHKSGNHIRFFSWYHFEYDFRKVGQYPG